MQRQPRAIVEGFIESAYNDGDLTAIDRYVSPRVGEHDIPARMARGIEGTREYFRMLIGAFWGQRTWIETIHAQGDLVFVRTITRGIHAGGFLGLEPTGARAMLCSSDIYRVADGRIVEHWGTYAAWAVLTDASGSRPRIPRAA